MRETQIGVAGSRGKIFFGGEGRVREIGMLFLKKEKGITTPF